MITSIKKSVQQLTALLPQKGVEKVVISPGSRNAPLIIGFTNHPSFTCYAVPDERVAAFIALGMAHETGKPVALVCSSGSALLNYYPAIAEAYYRNIPLVVLSADRPNFLIDQADGQTIRQQNVFANHIRYSVHLTDDANSKEEWENARKINEALNAAISPDKGPVHINIPFAEPLYDTTDSVSVTYTKNAHVWTENPLLSNEQQHYIHDKIATAERPILLIGQKDSCRETDALIATFKDKLLVLTETTSNVYASEKIGCIDRFLMGLTDVEKEKFHPDVLITMGGFIVSKKVKQHLRKQPISHHFHIGTATIAPDTYLSLSDIVKVSNITFLSAISPATIAPKPWVQVMMTAHDRTTQRHNQVMADLPYSDFYAVRELQPYVQSNEVLHLANSTSVRYAQLFDQWRFSRCYGNRGTSGIDGIVSTAVGHAISSDVNHWLLVGDISFFYDSNALWHAHIPTNLKIVVLNNSGGGIFRFIDGPKRTGKLAPFFETQQSNSVAAIAESFELAYFKATDAQALPRALAQLQQSKRPGILEIVTPREENAEILKSYFSKLH